MKKRGLKSPDRADAFVLTFGKFMDEEPEHSIIPSIGFKYQTVINMLCFLVLAMLQ